MAAPKGHKRYGGRKKGTPNKIAGELREMVLTALNEAGGVAYLRRCARSNPPAFLSLLGRILPMQISGEGGGPVVYQVISGAVPARED
jgi:hypothetical protein